MSKAAQPAGLAGRLDPLWVVRSPATAWNVIVLAVLAGVIAAVLLWAQREPKIAVGQVMPNTRVVRLPLEIPDQSATESDRLAARQRTPRVYVADAALLDEIRVSLENLPRALADARTLDEVRPEIRRQFGMNTEGMLAAVRAQAGPGADEAWREQVGRLDRYLRVTPLIDQATYQAEVVAVNERIKLLVGDAKPVEARASEVTQFDGAQVEARLRGLAAMSGFTGDLLQMATTRLVDGARPTFKYDAALTEADRQAAAEQVPARTNAFTRGQIIYIRGDVLTQDRLDLFKAEAAAFRQRGPRTVLWGHDMGLMVAGLITALGLAAYTATYAPRIWRSPSQVAAVSCMIALATLGSAAQAIFEPRLLALAIAMPALLVTMVLAVAYDRATALALGSMVAILACVGLEQPVGTIGIALGGVWVAVWQLKEFRHRGTLIRAGTLSGAALAVFTLALAGLQRPMEGPAFAQALFEAGVSAVGAILTALIVLGFLPQIEKLFRVTTGMSLIELRDPSHPLLRMMQQRAPGTYNHSLNVAALAEAAAEAVGADSLLTYVGALYHDVGKANKPEYFVENQIPGLNRHDKLSPAMSLLVIVGHVREGIELARAHDLPRTLHHFIESHHGTTLVEYFYHRARQQAEKGVTGPGGMKPEMPQEIEYRYPGPRPRTREAAILMICDASESATRAMAEPTPARIDSLVRAIAHKRLMDGQFDHSDLTLKDVATIIETVSRTLAAIHHGRIAYPGDPLGGPPKTTVPLTAVVGREATAAVRGG